MNEPTTEKSAMTKSITMWIPEELHTRLKLRATRDRESMTAIAIRIIEAYLEERMNPEK